MRFFLKKLLILSFLGKSTVIFLTIGFIASLCLGFIELMIALFIQVLLVSLGLIESGNIKFSGFEFSSVSIQNALVFLCVIGFCRFFFQMLSSQSASYASEKFGSRLRTIAIHDFLFSVTSKNQNASDIFFRFTEIIPKTGGMVSSVILLLSTLLQCISIFYIMLFSAWKEALLSLIGIFFIGLLALKMSKQVKKVTLLVPRESMNLSLRIEKASRNLLFFGIMRTKKIEFKKLSENVLNLSNYVLRTTLITTFISSFTPFMGIILVVLIISFSKLYWQNSSLVLISFLYLLIRFVQNLSSLSSQYGLIQSYLPQFKISYKYFSDYPINRDINYYTSFLKFKGTSSAIEIPDIKSDSKDISYINNSSSPKIEINNLYYSYNKNDNVINNLSLLLEPGKQLGIIGVSGAGKSTLLLLIIGILKPEKGEILIDNIPPEKYFDNLNNRIGYVGAEPYLIKGSLRDNLVYGLKKEVSDDEIYQALDKASMTSFIQKVGLNYEINEDQSGLSAGQKQRLCIARAVLNKPKLLVLDEASANLDEVTEEEIAFSILKLKEKCTIVVVSHRPGMLKYVDKVLTL